MTRNILTFLLCVMITPVVFANDWQQEMSIIDFGEENEPDISEVDGARMYYDDPLEKLRCSEEGGSFVDCITKGLTNNAPSSPSDICEVLDAAHDTEYLYICVATNTWERVQLATWASECYHLKIDGTYKFNIDGTNYLELQNCSGAPDPYNLKIDGTNLFKIDSTYNLRVQ